MFGWYVLIHILTTHRSRLMALPTCLHGIVSQQRSNTERMREEIQQIFNETILIIDEKKEKKEKTVSSSKISQIILGAFQYKNTTPLSYQESVIQHLTLDDKNINNVNNINNITNMNNTNAIENKIWYHLFLDFYLIQQKDKILNLPELLNQFLNNEEKLAAKIEKKYSPMRMHGTWRKRASPCLWVQADEIVPKLLSLSTTTNNQVRYFVVDCRYESETKWGKFGSAFWINPKKIADNEEERNLIMESLEALRGQVRI
jgi:hypothetical protein